MTEQTPCRRCGYVAVSLYGRHLNIVDCLAWQQARPQQFDQSRYEDQLWNLSQLMGGVAQAHQQAFCRCILVEHAYYVKPSNPLRALRRAMGWTLGDVARVTCLSVAKVSAIERGKAPMGKLAITWLVQSLGVKLDHEIGT